MFWFGFRFKVETDSESRVQSQYREFAEYFTFFEHSLNILILYVIMKVCMA